jgi:hypothetical protein
LLAELWALRGIRKKMGRERYLRCSGKRSSNITLQLTERSKLRKKLTSKEWLNMDEDVIHARKD